LRAQRGQLRRGRAVAQAVASIAATTWVAAGNSASAPRRWRPDRRPSAPAAPATRGEATSATRTIDAGRAGRVIVRAMAWVRMRFKGSAGLGSRRRGGKPVIDSTGRAEMKYRESDAKSYRPRSEPATRHGSDGRASSLRTPPCRRSAGGRAHAATGPATEIWTDGACSGNPGRWGSAS
jgi:hypothetical protein